VNRALSTSIGTNPQRLFRTVAIAEAVTWALLLSGMFLKYVTETTELGVRIFGMVHGVVFVAYGLTTLLVAVDQRWTLGRTLLGLAAAVPPFCTVLFDWYAEKRGALAGAWRLTSTEPVGGLDRPVAWLLRNPVRGALAGLVAVAALTCIALLVGPPAS
jgi:integral membrane protein